MANRRFSRWWCARWRRWGVFRPGHRRPRRYQEPLDVRVEVALPSLFCCLDTSIAGKGRLGIRFTRSRQHGLQPWPWTPFVMRRLVMRRRPGSDLCPQMGGREVADRGVPALVVVEAEPAEHREPGGTRLSATTLRRQGTHLVKPLGRHHRMKSTSRTAADPVARKGTGGHKRGILRQAARSVARPPPDLPGV